MNKTCARCEKTVYPIEELKCLDKIWHKGCFKCQECGMTLNMKSYKGYGKLPYCEAHIPKVKPTTMAETPELKRIAENTKIQSNVKYHADFEKSKGKFTQVADDPEILRIRANTKIISNVAYHGDLEKKAAMEKQRTLNENGDAVVAHQAQSLPQNRRIGSVADIDPLNEVYGSLANTHISQQPQNNQALYQHQQSQQQSRLSQQQPPPSPHQTKPSSGVSGRIYIAMYDYEATDSDEVSFREGDLITNVSDIDSGWMTGRIQRTGQTGMLPANYVELARI